MSHTERRNLNRGFMKLEVWNDSMELYKSVFRLFNHIPQLDFKLRNQLLDASQSISANIAEGYCRKSINEYLYFLNIALGSCGEVLTRLIGLKETQLLSKETYEEIDKIHYEVENKLLALVKSLQAKRVEGSWDDQIHDSVSSYSIIP